MKRRAGWRRKAARRGEYNRVSVAELQLPDLEADPYEQVRRKAGKAFGSK